MVWDLNQRISEDDLNIMRYRMAATFLRYIHYIDMLREKGLEELEIASEKAQANVPIIEEWM
jgi:hypothetical protein